MEGSFSGSIRVPGVADNDEEGENLMGNSYDQLSVASDIIRMKTHIRRDRHKLSFVCRNITVSLSPELYRSRVTPANQLTSRKSHLLDQQGRKVSECVQAIREEKVHARKDPKHRRDQGGDELVLVEMLVCSLWRELTHSFDGPFSFFVVQPFSGSVRHNRLRSGSSICSGQLD